MKVLLLEDDERCAELVRTYLSSHGFVVDHASLVADADAYVETATYDVMILDRDLPDGDGQDWLRQQRKRDDHTPAIFMSVWSDSDQKINGLEAGGDDYVPKGIPLNELAARARAIMRRSQHDSFPTFRAGNVELDPANRSAVVAEKTAHLTRREIDLLEVLLRRKGRTVTREALEQSLYCFDKDFTPNSIEVCVCRLRKSLKFYKADVQISTIRGLGYILHTGEN